MMRRVERERIIDRNERKRRWSKVVGDGIIFFAQGQGTSSERRIEPSNGSVTGGQRSGRSLM